MVLYKYIFTIILLLPFIDILGQNVVVKTPQPTTLNRGAIISTNPGNRNIPQIPSISNSHGLPYNDRNRQQLQMYEQDRREVERRNMELQRNLNNDFSGISTIQYNLPSWAGTQGTDYYYQAAKELLDMLHGDKPLNLKNAVFITENAYFEGQLNKNQYEQQINAMINIARLKAQQDGYNWNNTETKNMMLFRVMADTIRVKFPMNEKYSTSFPMQYDFDDFRGETDYSKLFVTKLLSSHTGQCHSLPLLYLILCEKVGVDAYLAFSPQHSYIKFKDRKNNWHNLELTQGRMVTDAFVVGSGFINAASIKNRVYMEPQDKKQVIAHCLSDLASGYIHKYGYDNFVIQCVDSALQYAPGNNTALAIKSNYHGAHLHFVARQIGMPPLDTLKTRFPEVYQMYEKRNGYYRHLDDIGFVQMPKEIYEKWLKSVNEEKERREHDIRYKNIFRLIE